MKPLFLLFVLFAICASIDEETYSHLKKVEEDWRQSISPTNKIFFHVCLGDHNCGEVRRCHKPIPLLPG